MDTKDCFTGTLEITQSCDFFLPHEIMGDSQFEGKPSVYKVRGISQEKALCIARSFRAANPDANIYVVFRPDCVQL